MSAKRMTRRRWLVPEVVQTSAMDCGPAVLACLLNGHGIRADYGRLREACQTDLDGTSIDVLERVACEGGLPAEQVMLPADHLLLPEADALPAVVVTFLPSGMTHFVLLWRRHGPFVQVMDPGEGRRWLSGREFLREVYVHAHRLPAAAWREWAGGEGLAAPLARRLGRLGIGRGAARTLFDLAAAGPDWRPLGRLDAATRLIAALVRNGGVRRGRAAGAVLDGLLAAPDTVIPETFWSVTPAPPGDGGEQHVFLRGAVLVRVAEGGGASGPPQGAGGTLALGDSPAPSARTLLRLLGPPQPFSGLLLLAGLALMAGAAVLEGLLLRGALDIGRELRLPEQRLTAAGAFLGLGLVVLFAEWRLIGKLLRLGRRLELVLRMALLRKLPRTHDRYFQSRAVSDMAERAHVLFQVRQFPRQAGQFVQAGLGLALTAGAIAWLDPAGAPLALAAAVLALLLPLVCNPLLAGLDLRQRTHAGALCRFYLDALLGLSAVRAHGAEAALRLEHEALLTEWARAGRRLLRAAVYVEAAQLLTGFGLAGWLLLLHAGRFGDPAAALLLAYWVLNLPLLGQEVAALARQYPLHRNVTLRLLEPLGAPGPADSRDDSFSRGDVLEGVAVTFEAVDVRAGGHIILKDVELGISAGSHVAVVGPSGSGKSTLVGLLLGWHEPSAGTVHVDGEALTPAHCQRLREETAWVDPAVRLWNRSLLSNLLYGTPEGAAVGEVLSAAALHEVLQRLPDGLQTPLGEGGGLVSGGEGQRVRFGRGLGRARARLVILDEPFRGLDREQRRDLLRRARAAWSETTLLCVTHDVGETRQFPRVLVVEGGRVVEDGPPDKLLADPASRYAALLRADDEALADLWGSAAWRRLRLKEGRVATESGGAP